MPIQGFDLGALLGDTSTFIEYHGSQTAPPCMEGVIWLVKRERETLGHTQMAAFAQRLHKTTADGNYRSVAPLNARHLRVLSAEASLRSEDPSLAKAPLPLGPNARTDGEFRSLNWAHKAAEIGEEADDYISDFRNRLRRSAESYRVSLS